MAVFLTRTLARIWRDGEAILFTGIIDPSEERESRLGTVGCVVIGVFSHMSCEVELFYDHSGVKPTF